MYLGITLLFRERVVMKRAWFLTFIYLFRSEHCQISTLVQRISFWGLKLFTGASTEAPILENSFSNFAVGDYHCAHS